MAQSMYAILKMTSMKMKIIIPFVFLILGEVIFTKASDSCKMEDFPVQENFDEDKFQGKWYEYSWILLDWIKPEWNYFDFINNYTKTDYGLAVFANGRWPFNASDCATPTTPRLIRTGENAKYTKEFVGKNKILQNSSYWIVDTDYDNYALVIGCSELASNGTCVVPNGWLWTRCPNARVEDVKYMENRLPEFCLSKDMFLRAYQNTECRADILDSCSHAELIPPVTSNDCRMADFKVQENFDEERFQGKWYEVSWIPVPWVPAEYSYFDYFHNYTRTDYGFSCTAEGRWPANATECEQAQYRFFRVGNAKYLYELGTPDGILNMTHWVVDTDYDNYAFFVGCRELASNGTCIAPNSWMWTRCQVKPKEYVDKIWSKLSEFCLTKEQYWLAIHQGECRDDIPDSCPPEVKDSDGAGHCIHATHATTIMAFMLSILVIVNYN